MAMDALRGLEVVTAQARSTTRVILRARSTPSLQALPLLFYKSTHGENPNQYPSCCARRAR